MIISIQAIESIAVKTFFCLVGNKKVMRRLNNKYDSINKDKKTIAQIILLHIRFGKGFPINR